MGRGMMNDACMDVHIVNELDVPILAMGLQDVIISASPDGILVSDKNASDGIKPFVDSFEQQVMFAEKSWGDFKVMDVGKIIHDYQGYIKCWTKNELSQS